MPCLQSVRMLATAARRLMQKTPELMRERVGRPALRVGNRSLPASRISGSSRARIAERQQRRQHGSHFAAQAGRHTDGGRHPQARRGGEPAHVVVAVDGLDDGARAQKADAGHHALDHAADVGRVAPACSGTSTNKAAPRATSMWVRSPADLPARSRSKPQQGAQQGCQQQAHAGRARDAPGRRDPRTPRRRWQRCVPSCSWVRPPDRAVPCSAPAGRRRAARPGPAGP